MTELKVQIKQLIISSLDLEDMTTADIADDEALFVDGLGLDSIRCTRTWFGNKKTI